MEYYDWTLSPSRKSLESLFEKPYTEIENSALYVDAVDKLMNEGTKKGFAQIYLIFLLHILVKIRDKQTFLLR